MTFTTEENQLIHDLVGKCIGDTYATIMRTVSLGDAYPKIRLTLVAACMQEVMKTTAGCLAVTLGHSDSTPEQARAHIMEVLETALARQEKMVSPFLRQPLRTEEQAREDVKKERGSFSLGLE